MCLFTALLHELGLLGESARGKGIFPLQFSLVIALAVIGWCIISDCITGTQFIVVSYIPLDRIFEFIPSSAPFNTS